MKPAKTFPFFLFTLTIFVLLFAGCTDKSVDPAVSEDYFPVNHDFVYTYKSNVFNDSQDSMSTFQMKIDYYNFKNGKFLAILIKLENMNDWAPLLGIKDSNNVIYSLGDYPPEGLFPLFKHKYDDNEVTGDEVNIGGKTYNAKKLTVTRDGREASWWFVDGIGLVKEESVNGISIFSDNHVDRNFVTKTELISFTK